MEIVDSTKRQTQRRRERERERGRERERERGAGEKRRGGKKGEEEVG